MPPRSLFPQRWVVRVLVTAMVALSSFTSYNLGRYEQRLLSAIEQAHVERDQAVALLDKQNDLMNQYVFRSTVKK